MRAAAGAPILSSGPFLLAHASGWLRLPNRAPSSFLKISTLDLDVCLGRSSHSSYAKAAIAHLSYLYLSKIAGSDTLGGSRTKNHVGQVTLGMERLLRRRGRRVTDRTTSFHSSVVAAA
jgi:hypothetical protein